MIDAPRIEFQLMDLRTGKLYTTVDEALADGVPESDIALVKTGTGLTPTDIWPFLVPR